MTQISALADPGSPRYLAFAISTTILVGMIQIAMGIVRLGVVTNFLSRPVLSGFTSAAACLIAFSQAKHLLGVKLPPTEQLHQLLTELAHALPQTNLQTLAISAASVSLLLVFQYLLPPVLKSWKRLPTKLARSLSKSGPIVAVTTFVIASSRHALDMPS